MIPRDSYDFRFYHCKVISFQNGFNLPSFKWPLDSSLYKDHIYFIIIIELYCSELD